MNFVYRRIEGFEFSLLFDDLKYDYYKYVNEVLYIFKKIEKWIFLDEIVIMFFCKIIWW